MISWSLPSRERGLKCGDGWVLEIANNVAPLAGAWVEITINLVNSGGTVVAPLAGAWVEMD